VFLILQGLSSALVMADPDQLMGKPVPPKAVLLLQELRAPFFTASIAPVLVGAALAFYYTGVWHWPLFLLTMAAMILIHAGSNVANDYFDHLSGNDEKNVDFVRPFTGGSRMIQNGLLKPMEVLILSLVCFALGGSIGLYLAWKTGWVVVLTLGAMGVIGGFFYTSPPLRLVARGVGEVVIGLNFGVLPVIGTYYVLTGTFIWEVALFSLPVAILIASVLFINQFQDYDADKAVGKNHWVVRLGCKHAARVFAILMIAWPLPIVAGVVLRAGPALAIIAAILPIVIAGAAINKALHCYDKPRELAPANAMTIVTHFAVAVLLAATLIISRIRL